MKLIDKCRDLCGTLSDANQHLIESVLAQPCAQSWEMARLVVISPAPLLTLDMAVNRVSGKLGDELPSSFTLYRALDYAIKKREHYLNRPRIESQAV